MRTKDTGTKIKPFVVFLLLLSGSFSLHAATLVIDDFNDDLAPVTSDTLLDGSMLGGEVEIFFAGGIDGTLAITGGVCELSGVTTGGSISFGYDGDDDSMAMNDYGLLAVDFTDGGTNNAIAIDFVSITGSVDVQVAIADSDTDQSVILQQDVTEAGVLEIPFHEFVTLAGSGGNIESVKVLAVGIVVDSGEGFEIGSIRAVNSSRANAGSVGTPGVIDTFSENLDPIVSDTFLSGPMLGGQVNLGLISGLSGTFAITDGTGRLTDVSSGGNMQFVYGGDSPTLLSLPVVDFTNRGANDRFTVNLTSVTGTVDLIIYLTRDGTNISYCQITGVSRPGEVHFPFLHFVGDSAAGDVRGAKQLLLHVVVDDGESFQIDSILATDSTIPTVGLLKKKKMKKPKRRHIIRGYASDNHAVARVEVQVRGKGWRIATPLSPGLWKNRTPKLKSRKNKIEVRAWDFSGNVSPLVKVRAKGE